MKMHLFILPSNARNAGRDKTIGSFPSECVERATVVSNWEVINKIDKEGQWFGVFYDNEYIDKDIKRNLKTFLMTIGNNALVFYKKNYVYQTADFCPRIFKNGIKLSGLFKTDYKIEFEKILNGWICEHGYN